MDPASGHPQALVKEPYALRFTEALIHVTKRQILMALRDSALIKGRLIQVNTLPREACLICCLMLIMHAAF